MRGPDAVGRPGQSPAGLAAPHLRRGRLRHTSPAGQAAQNLRPGPDSVLHFAGADSVLHALTAHVHALARAPPATAYVHAPPPRPCRVLISQPRRAALPRARCVRRGLPRHTSGGQASPTPAGPDPLPPGGRTRVLPLAGADSVLTPRRPDSARPRPRACPARHGVRPRAPAPAVPRPVQPRPSRAARLYPAPLRPARLAAPHLWRGRLRRTRVLPLAGADSVLTPCRPDSARPRPRACPARHGVRPRAPAPAVPRPVQ